MAMLRSAWRMGLQTVRSVCSARPAAPLGRVDALMKAHSVSLTFAAILALGAAVPSGLGQAATRKRRSSSSQPTILAFTTPAATATGRT